LGTVPRAGGTETAEGTGAKDYKFTLAKRLARRLRERLSLRAPRRVFHGSLQFGSLQFAQVQNSLAVWRDPAPHIPRVFRSTRLRLTLGVLDDEE
jgi:hypothetical protein